MKSYCNFMMYFWFKLLYVTLVLNNTVAETQTMVLKNGTMETQKYVFSHTNLGHSGILMTWKPCTRMPSNEYQPLRYFKFGTRIKDSKNDNISFSEWNISSAYHHRSEDIYTIHTYNKPQLSLISSLCQYKIHSLKENTFYEIIIQQYLNTYSPREKSYSPPEESSEEAVYSLVIKTNKKTNTKPAKPNFKIEPTEKSFVSYVYWLPRSKEYCHINEVGTHFAVKIRLLDRKGEYRFTEYLFDHTTISSITAGIPYEVILISINGDYETESDPQEIIIQPAMSAVTSVKVISYPNASILVSWKPPKHALDELRRYMVTIVNYNIAASNPFICIAATTSIELNKRVQPLNEFLTEGLEKLFDKSANQLKPGDTYIISIIPLGYDRVGIEYRVKYTIPANNADECVAFSSASYLPHSHTRAYVASFVAVYYHHRFDSIFSVHVLTLFMSLCSSYSFSML